MINQQNVSKFLLVTLLSLTTILASTSISAKTLQELEQEALDKEQRSLKKAKTKSYKKKTKKRKSQLLRAAAKHIFLDKKKPTAAQLAFLQQELGNELVTIKGSCFQLGSPETEEHRDGDEKQHLVCMNDFEIGRYEVTKAKFSHFISATHYLTDAEKTDGCNGWDGQSWKKDRQYSWRNPGFSQTETDPVTCVSWQDAIAYTDWLSAQTGQRYRLPTEAEWEYAARANTKTAYPWGESIGNNQSNCYQNCDDNYAYTAPVGHFSAYNGLHDMHGNVWEWTCSEYDYNYNDKDQQCLVKDSGNHSIVVRGGSWLDLPEKLRSAARDGWDSSDRGLNLGFRIARSL